jgi:enoyl-[acyl-carrier protein] reductase II
MENRITNLFGIKYPIIQAGMVWVSGHKLASAVSNCGCLGLIGSGSMKPDLLREHILKLKSETDKTFGVNIPLLRGDAEDLINICLNENVKIVFTSAGSPLKFTKILKKANCKVVHVISNVKQALKSQEAGCDAVVAEGFEAGGHNGIDELTTIALIPQIVDALNIPVIAAGGIADGRGVLAAFALGAEAVQIGTLFAASVESSAHENYKKAIVNAQDINTRIFTRKKSPTRALSNKIVDQLITEELKGASEDRLNELIDKKREFKGIFEGNLEEGFLEAGQSSGLVKSIKPVKEIVYELIISYNNSLTKLETL